MIRHDQPADGAKSGGSDNGVRVNRSGSSAEKTPPPAIAHDREGGGGKGGGAGDARRTSSGPKCDWSFQAGSESVGPSVDFTMVYEALDNDGKESRK